MFYGQTLNKVAQAALVTESAPVIRKAGMPARQAPSKYIAQSQLFQAKIAQKQATGALKSAVSVSRDLQRSGKAAPGTEGATQLLLSRLQKGKAKSSAIPAILRLPESEQYSQLRPQALRAASRMPKLLAKKIALLKTLRKLSRKRLRLQIEASKRGEESASKLLAAQVADASAQVAALETSIIADAAARGLGSEADILSRAAELEAVLEEEAESSLDITDADLLEAGSENEDIILMEDIESGAYLEAAAAQATDAAPLFSEDDSSALIEGPSGAAALATPRNLLLLAAAAGIGYVLFLRN